MIERESLPFLRKQIEVKSDHSNRFLSMNVARTCIIASSLAMVEAYFRNASYSRGILERDVPQWRTAS
jgi:hypothetical protein